MSRPDGTADADAVWIERVGTRLELGGSPTAAGASAWREAVLASACSPVESLALADLELDSGLAVVEAVNLVTQLRERHGPLVLSEAPQMLAHTLYKIGALTRGISLEHPRTGSGTTAN